MSGEDKGRQSDGQTEKQTNKQAKRQSGSQLDRHRESETKLKEKGVFIEFEVNC